MNFFTREEVELHYKIAGDKVEEGNPDLPFIKNSMEKLLEKIGFMGQKVCK